MNGIFFLLPFLLVLSLGIYQDTFALETYRGYDYQTIENPDGTTTWRGGLTPWMLENGQYVPFVFTDGPSKTVETEYGSVRLKSDGIFSFYNNGRISGEEKFTDKILAKYADVSDLNTWTYPNSINNDVPTISWDGSELVSRKSSAIGILDYKYVNNDGKWKTQLEATNLSGLTTKAFGFDQIIDLNRDTIKFNGIERNLDNFNNTTFDKQWLIDNKAKVIDLLNGINFDFDLGFENLYSVTVQDTGANKSRLIFDYRTSTALLPGETLVIDPTYSSDNPTADAYLEDSSGDNICNTSDGTKYNVTVLEINRYSLASGAECDLSYLEYDISTIPSDATVTDVDFLFDVVSTTGGGINCTYVSLGTVRESDPAADIFAAILSGTAMLSNDATCTTVGDNQSVDFGAVGDSQVQARVTASSGFFTFGIKPYDLTLDATTYGEQIASETHAAPVPPPTLEITYTTGSPPNPVTVLNDANLGANSLDLVWDAPNSFGSGTFQTYTINYTTPHGDPVTFLANSTNLYYNVTGLTFGTDYSFRVAARTEIAGNNTGAYILNITTTATTYSLPPTSLVASSNSATQIDLQWVASAMDNILGYRIERETPIDTGWSCATVTCNTTNTNIFYNNTGLSTNIIYNYRVYALNGSGISTASNTYDMTTYHLPDAVTDLTGSATDLSTIDLSWSAPTSYAPEIEGYMINGTTPTGEPVDILNSNTGTDATTATALNLLIGQEYSFRISPITVHGMNASGNIWNGSTIQTFVIGNLSNPDITNDDDFSIFFDRTDINASAIQLDVTYPNSYNLSCDFDYKYAMINQTYSSLTTVPDGTDDQVATFTLINATGDLVQVRCWDTITGDESTYVITITDFPFLEQIQSLRNGDYGTFFQIGAFDGVMLIIIFLGMVGLNRTTPIVGIIFVVITTLTMSYFQLITYPVIMYPALIMMIVWAYITTRKDD